MKNESIDANDDVKFESNEVSDLLNSFKEKLKMLEQIQDELCVETTKMKNDWQGPSSEEVLPIVDKLEKEIENNKVKNQDVINELNTIIDRYVYEEKTNIDTVNENVNSFDFTRQKGV